MPTVPFHPRFAELAGELLTLSLACVVPLPRAFAQDDERRLIDWSSTWRYLPGLAEASSPDVTAWRAPEFDDASWLEGDTAIGAGLNVRPLGTDLARGDPPMRNHYSSFFLRRTFDVADASLVGDLRARFRYDDGVVLWLNGVEVYRDRVQGARDEPVPFDAVATIGHDPSLVVERTLDFAGLLRSGRNVFAAQVFNTGIEGTDAYFNLVLVDAAPVDTEAPGIAWIEPPPGAPVHALSEVHVVFDEEVMGVEGTDLRVGGRPAALARGEGRGPYVFTVPAFTLPGEVALEWASGHGIVDRSGLANGFAGGSWRYLVDPSLPAPEPLISELLAVAGSEDTEPLDDDWIEIYNPAPAPVDLEGWSLSDSRDEPDAWVFPPVTLGPFERLVVLASDEDEPALDGELRASFRLSSAGQYLGLFPPGAAEAVSEYAPRYPPQRPGHSYGRTAAGVLGYFEAPSPGEPNASTV